MTIPADALRELSEKLREEARSLKKGDDYSQGGAAAREIIALRLDDIALRLYSTQPIPEANDACLGKGTEQHGENVNPSDTSMKSIGEVQRFRPTLQKSGQSSKGYIAVMTAKEDPRDSDYRGEDSRAWVRAPDYDALLADYAALLQRAEAAEARLAEVGKLLSRQS